MRTVAALLLGLCLQAQAFDLQGHRGARGLAPENTMAGFERTLAIGVNTLETDIAISRDGVLLISHDPALNPDITRGPDGQFLSARGPVIWLTDFAELQRHDVGRLKPGTRYAEQYPAQQPSNGARLPKARAVQTNCTAAPIEKPSGSISTRFSAIPPSSQASAVRFGGPASATSGMSALQPPRSATAVSISPSPTSAAAITAGTSFGPTTA